MKTSPDLLNQERKNTDLELILRKYLIGVVEFIVHESSDDAGFPDGLIAQEHELVFRKSRNRGHFRKIEIEEAEMRRRELVFVFEPIED